MIRILPLFLTLLFPQELPAWDGSDHQTMGRLALEEVSKDWGLDVPVEVQPLQSLLNKLAPLRTEWSDARHFSDSLKINPKANLEKVVAPAEGKAFLTPLEILSDYSIDPDDGRDQDLPLLSPDQKWFGVMIGPNSQAFRHIEKPPFRIRHPLSTFGFPLRAVGEATVRAEIYFQASLLAFSLDEPYWGWRLLANSLHYIQDLHQPYHAGQITPGLLARGLWATLRWGWREKGFMGTMSHVVSNSHRFYESYVSQPGNGDQGIKREALQALRGSETSGFVGTVQDLARKIRDESNLKFPAIICAVTEISDSILFSSYDFKSDMERADDPSQFLKKGPDFERANRRIFEITRERFQSAGRAIRTVVHAAIEGRRTKNAEEILKAMDRLLARS